MTEYILALIATLIVAALSREALYTACVVAVGFVLNEGFCRITGIYDCWPWFTLTDSLSVLVLIFRNKWLPDFGKIGAAVAAIFCTQIVIHWAYWLSGGTDADVYWQTLTSMAFVQLAIIALGGVSGGGKLYHWMRRLWPVSTVRHPVHRRQAERGDGE